VPFWAQPGIAPTVRRRERISFDLGATNKALAAGLMSREKSAHARRVLQILETQTPVAEFFKARLPI
jgi:hypothetical protein